MAKGKSTKNLIILLIGLIILAAGGLLGYQFITKTGIFYVPGEIHYASDIDPEIQSQLTTLLVDIEIDRDVTIGSRRSSTRQAQPMDILYNISVPITDFYNPVSNLSSSELETAISDGGVSLIPILELDNTVKLLSIDDQYFLQTFDSGAYFDYLEITGDEQDVVKITTLIQDSLPDFPTKDTVLSFVQTGVTALSRGMNAKLNQVGDAGYFAANIGEYLSGFDLTHTSNEASFSTYANSNNICAKPGMINALTAIGLDIVELTGNHNQDCGDESALDTIKQYRELGIMMVGGGETAEAASIPLEINEKGTGITMLGYNLSTGGYTLDATPGANFYTPEKASADIAAAKARGDFIIVDVQYYECNEYNETYETTYCDYANSSAGDQIGLFRQLIDMGADIVVGTSAHQTQTYEKYGNGIIYYGLGNLFFDQIWWPSTTRSIMLEHYFYQGKLLQTRIVPTIYDSAMQVRIMDNETAEWFINRLNQARPAQ